MTELKKMTDRELAARICGYVEQIDSLAVRAEYYCGLPCPDSDLALLRKDYKKLKTSVLADAQYCVYNKQGGKAGAVYDNRYVPSVLASAAHGFAAPEDCNPDGLLIESLEKARSNLLKEFPLDYWKILME